MGRFVRLLIAVFFLAPITAMAQQDEIAVDLVECVNLANGHSIQLNEAAWELSQANLDLVYDQYLEGGYYFVRGRPLGWHGT
ncbi:hypothetical protein [Cochlodiniinecator piscidefendens]|uniref:hypothetical protein n=1 Tax=Cochlodiniinecator piscidefendens TaxID=2715756 RepID=UPI0014086B53|nr:hypothetical protein [Cochlodiniinecator piscidefendens]